MKLYQRTQTWERNDGKGGRKNEKTNPNTWVQTEEFCTNEPKTKNEINKLLIAGGISEAKNHRRA
jgi:hypothetical protein